jgi:protein-S-isoprenylcysteine O-methyltransferase Ste14
MGNFFSSPTSIVIASAWAGFVLYWIISAPGRRNVVLGVALFAAVGCAFFLLGSGSVPDDANPVLWNDTLPVAICADAVVLMGLSLLIWARRTLGANWSATVRKNGNAELVRRGPYAFVRHPIYTGLVALVLGTAAAYGRLIGVLVLVTCCVGLYLKALKEESVLKLRFPDTFPEYKAKTKMLIPFIL